MRFFLLIGFKPFVEACIDADEKSEAVKYISKLADPREKAEVFKYLYYIYIYLYIEYIIIIWNTYNLLLR